MGKLEIVDNLIKVQTHNNVALEGQLLCDCGSEDFYVKHNGKQTKGFLASDIIPINGNLSIIAHCIKCGKTFNLVTRGQKSLINEYKDLEIKNEKQYKITMMYNYHKGKMIDSQGQYTNDFCDLMIEVNTRKFKDRRIFE